MAVLTTDSTIRRLAFSLLFSAVLLAMATPVSAIVTRHDTGYSRFLARESDYPAVFPLYIEQRRKTCAATLISPRWALTAAHCAHETPLAAELAGTGIYAVQVAGQRFNIDMLVLHPDWTERPDSLYDPGQVDLALIRFDTELTHVTPMALYQADNELNQLVTFLGWGFSGMGRTGISVNDGRLRFARNQVSVADQQLYFRFNNPDAQDGLSVAFEGIPGLGDSGGPALIDSEGELLLAGIAIGELSPADGSERRLGLYGTTVVYERVSRHLQWIAEVIAEDRARATAYDNVCISDGR